MKILLISGHGAGDPGASSKFGVEATETVVMVQEIQKALAGYADVTLYPTDRNAYSDILAGGLKVKPSDYDYVLEVHFNACVNDTAGDGKTTGTEIYVTTSESGVTVEQAIVNQIAKLGFKNRGVKRTNFSVIYNCKKAGTSAALLETCFIDDKDDMTIYNGNKAAVARAAAQGIIDGFGLKKSGSGSSGQSSGNTSGTSGKKVVNAKCASPEAFIKLIAPLCQADYKKHNVLPSLSITQACLESGYGTSDLYVYGGAAFGIKASRGWNGKIFRKSSKEVYNGVTKYEESDFRAYDNLEASVADHGEFLQKDRYKKVVGEKDFATAAKEIKAAGYATDPAYTNSLTNIYKKYNIGQYDSVVSGNAGKGDTAAQSAPGTAGTGSGDIQVGSVVTIAPGAVYGGLSTARGRQVPAVQCGTKKHTVAAIEDHKGVREAKLKEINSWVAVSSLRASGGGGIKVGSSVTISAGAVYGGLSTTRGRSVPAAQCGGKKHTVAALATHKGVAEAKLKEINSWVALSYLNLV